VHLFLDFKNKIYISLRELHNAGIYILLTKVKLIACTENNPYYMMLKEKDLVSIVRNILIL